MLTGLNRLNNPFLNKGTAFTKEERAKYGITGMLPSTVQTLEQQAVQAYGQYLSQSFMIQSLLTQSNNIMKSLLSRKMLLSYQLMIQRASKTA